MAPQILVALKRSDRIAEIIPYIEKIVQPGMRVVFLIPYPVERWLWYRDHWVTTESPREAILAGKKVMDRYSWEEQRGLAQHKVAAAREAFEKNGVDTAVDVYTGPLRRVLESYTANGNVYLIMMRAGISVRVMRFLHEAVPIFGLCKRANSSPVLLLRPD